jgi:cytochrome b6-f complex subunit 8
MNRGHQTTELQRAPVWSLVLGTLRPQTRIKAMLITVGWAALAATFTFSIAMVVWGRNGDGTLNF